MPLIEWKDEFSTGIAEVDDDHQDLVNLINLYYEDLSASPSATAVVDFLGAIYARISAHFTLEETVMLEIRYDHYEDHRAEHDRLLAEIRGMMADWTRGPGDLETLSRCLNEWFTEHFRNSDARFHGWPQPH